MIVAGELLITDISARYILGDTGFRGGYIGALVGKHFTTAVARNLARNLTGRTGSRMTEYGARMAARPWSRAKVAARVRCR